MRGSSLIDGKIKEAGLRPEYIAQRLLITVPELQQIREGQQGSSLTPAQIGKLATMLNLTPEEIRQLADERKSRTA